MMQYQFNDGRDGNHLLVLLDGFTLWFPAHGLQHMVSITKIILSHQHEHSKCWCDKIIVS